MASSPKENTNQAFGSSPQVWSAYPDSKWMSIKREPSVVVVRDLSKDEVAALHVDPAFAEILVFTIDTNQ